MQSFVPTTLAQKGFRILLGGLLTTAAVAHLTVKRREFQAQVPDAVPVPKDDVVLFSGAMELVFGVATLFWKDRRVDVGFALALFYVLIFPGNVAQYQHERDAFGLDTDEKRLGRLFFQPVLVAWALWSTGAFKALRR